MCIDFGNTQNWSLEAACIWAHWDAELKFFAAPSRGLPDAAGGAILAHGEPQTIHQIEVSETKYGCTKEHLRALLMGKRGQLMKS